MRFFRHTIADYTCTQRCGYVRSLVTPNLSPFHMIAAAAAAVPLWLVSLGQPWHFPWYYLFGIFAGELLLVFAAGLLSSLLLLPFTAGGTKFCRKCGAPMFFAGRHFDPLGSARPDWSDKAIFVAFLGANSLVWFVLARL